MSSNQDRSVSRGREVYQSSGRGGAGNIRQASASREARPQDGPDDFSTSRGREPVPSMTHTFSTGRGGAGNIRSPSRDKVDANTNPNPYPLNDHVITEEEFIQAHLAASQDIPFSSGRGGAGNIQLARSRSRPRSRGPQVVPPAPHDIAAPHMAHVHSTGRGGAGNIIPDTDGGYSVEHKDEEERQNLAARAGEGGVHSVGRGGVANMTTAHEMPIEHPMHVHTEYESSGRGGAGNIVRDQSVPRS